MTGLENVLWAAEALPAIEARTAGRNTQRDDSRVLEIMRCISSWLQ